MVRVLTILTLTFVLGTITEAGIICTDVDTSVVTIASSEGMDFDSEKEQSNVGIGENELMGFADLSFDSELVTPVGVFFSPTFRRAAHVESVTIAKTIRPRNPCLDGLLKPPQTLC